MKHIKRFSESEKIDESISGALIIGGILFSLFGGVGALLKYAKASWTKTMMEMKYKRTGKTENVPYTPAEGSQIVAGSKKGVYFEQLKDVSTGELFWACTFVDKSVAEEGYRNEQYLLFDEDGYKKVKEKILNREPGFLKGPIKQWSKTPAKWHEDDDWETSSKM